MKSLGLVAALVVAACSSIPAPAAAPVFTAQSVSKPENVGTFNFPVCKPAKSSSYSKVRAEDVPGSAKPGVDYKPFSTTYTVANSQLCFQVPITVLDNSLYQPDRTFGVRLVPVRNATVPFGYEPLTVTITEDDLPPTVPVPEPAPCPAGTVLTDGHCLPVLTTPTPEPTPTTTPPPGDGLAGEADVPDGLNVADWLIPGEPTFPVAAGDVGAFRFTCLAGHLAQDDPIVYPGQPGKSHLHQFFGNTGTNANSTYQTLRTSGGSTCTRSATESPQRTAYWMPAMLDGAGNAVKPDFINTYYKQLPKTDPECARTVKSETDYTTPGPNIGKCVPMPNGIRFILGHNMATMSGGPADLTSRDSEAMGFDCMVRGAAPGDSLTGVQRTMAAIVASGRCPVGSWLRVYLTFSQCWNGRDLDTPDHRSHIVFPPQSRCPQSHPYKVPEVAISAFFLVDSNFVAGRWELASDLAMRQMLGGTVVAGSTLHADYWEAWNPTIKALWQNGCIDGAKSCSTGNVGDGRMIRGMQQIGPYPSGVKVPLGSIATIQP